jgi:putative ABC transport system permease protein
MVLSESIKMAYASVKQNGKRTLITCCIIGFGIMALVGILTSIDGLKSYLNKSFSGMGANTFKIRNRSIMINFEGGSEEPKVFKPISLLEAQNFRKIFSEKTPVGIQIIGSYVAQAKFEEKKTNPNLLVFGVDDSYTNTEGYNIIYGRNFTSLELETGSPVTILGNEVADKLFLNKENGIGRNISVSDKRYKVIGVFEKKGNSMITTDNFVAMPLHNIRRSFSEFEESFVLSIKVNESQMLNSTIEDAKLLMRTIRKLRPTEENNFDVLKSDSFSEMLVEKTEYATIGGFIISIITLIGAAIGLMNIMLVSVTERTKEIGTLKAIGATRKDILYQFLTEAIFVCIMGGILGVVLGIVIGNAVSLGIGGDFIIPWNWMSMGIAFCVFVGLISGIYPAIRASKLDPIEALRYE